MSHRIHVQDIARLWLCMLAVALMALAGRSLPAQQDPAATPIATIAKAGRQVEKPLPARVIVDWEKKMLGIVAEKEGVAQGDEFQVVRQDEIPTSGVALPEIVLRDGAIIAVGTVDTLLGALTPGTRSLWLQRGGDGAPQYERVDLPAPQLKGASFADGDEDGGPTVTLRVAGLMPQFQIQYATQRLVKGDENERGHSSPSRFRPMSPAAFDLPRVERIPKEDDGLQQLKIHLPARSAGGRAYLVVIVNFDGSRSRTLRFEQHDAEINKQAGVAAAALPAPVDAEVHVPDVQFITVGEAVKKTHSAGLQPTLIDIDTYQTLPITGLEDATVRRQGLPSETAAFAGQSLLLGIRRNAGRSLSTYDPGDEPIPHSIPLDTGDRSGFVPVDIADTDDVSLTRPDEPFGENIAAPIADTFDDDAPNLIAAGADPANAEGAETDEDATDFDETGATSTVAIDPDPGVSIDPLSNSAENALASLLKVVLDAVEAQLDNGQAPGAIGRALVEAARATERELLEALKEGRPLDRLPVEKLLDVTVTSLGVELKPAERAAALDAWRKFASERRHPALLDTNANRTVSDDIVLWMIVWLQKSGVYNPASSAQLVGDGQGKAVAVLSSQPISPAWLTGAKQKPGQPPIVQSADAAKPSSGGLEVQEDEIKIEIPRGKSRVVTRSGPDRVRVPADLESKTAAEAKTRLDGIGLQIAKEGKLFAKDKVTGTRPEPGSWVKPDSQVMLDVLRLVPDVVKQKAEGAVDALKDKELKAAPANKDRTYRTDDVVVAQEPAAGKYVAA